jgi:alkylation response protein AidB-like acyl-CoA dehydrogenase
LRGEYLLALAATEPAAGSDLLSTGTEAELVGDSYIVNGEKRFITNGATAGYYVTLVRTNKESGMGGMSLLLVPGDAKGVTRERLPTIGFKTGDTGNIVFRDVRVPKKNLLGKEGRGFMYVLRGLQRERLVGAVGVATTAQYALNYTIQELKGRTRFGEPLARKQVIRHRLASLVGDLELTRSFVYKTCEQFVAGKPVDQEILIIKSQCYETCQRVIRECLHLHGGEGFLQTHRLAHMYQDSQAFTLAAGTTELMRDMLASALRL